MGGSFFYFSWNFAVIIVKILLVRYRIGGLFFAKKRSYNGEKGGRNMNHMAFGNTLSRRHTDPPVPG